MCYHLFNYYQRSFATKFCAMSRLFILALILSILADSAFGNIEELLRSIDRALGGSLGINSGMARSGFGIRTPNSEFSIGYGG
ncbi:uncharacterized protein LOC27207673 [Drosophila simulans]|uniref:Uncharacterized protein n=1 Tax=Drosophila simulans TaxID=7240 RepID=A0A0J9UB22_DROSI|nr:uncharacterized protein LOC27207673 [Drosophila simulans]KMY96530.1 uncharacterized protein Dsimw501_GD27824 [Drosophila simulans]